MLLDREVLAFLYREAMTKLGMEAPIDADIEQVCRDVREAIIAREHALHSGSPNRPAVNVLFAPKVGSDADAVRLLDALTTADRLP